LSNFLEKQGWDAGDAPIRTKHDTDTIALAVERDRLRAKYIQKLRCFESDPNCVIVDLDETFCLESHMGSPHSLHLPEDRTTFPFRTRLKGRRICAAVAQTTNGLLYCGANPWDDCGGSTDKTIWIFTPTAKASKKKIAAGEHHRIFDQTNWMPWFETVCRTFRKNFPGKTAVFRKDNASYTKFHKGLPNVGASKQHWLDFLAGVVPADRRAMTKVALLEEWRKLKSSVPFEIIKVARGFGFEVLSKSPTPRNIIRGFQKRSRHVPRQQSHFRDDGDAI